MVETSQPGRTMTAAEAERFVIVLLEDQGSLTTMEIEMLAREQGRQCPDQTVMFLMKMRKKGLVLGKVSMERRGWLWSLP